MSDHKKKPAADRLVEIEAKQKAVIEEIEAKKKAAASKFQEQIRDLKAELNKEEFDRLGKFGTAVVSLLETDKSLCAIFLPKFTATLDNAKLKADLAPILLRLSEAKMSIPKIEEAPPPVAAPVSQPET